MTQPGLGGVWKNVMVMYENMVGFSNVTGNMVLAGHRMASAYKRSDMLWEQDTLLQTKAV